VIYSYCTKSILQVIEFKLIVWLCASDIIYSIPILIALCIDRSNKDFTNQLLYPLEAINNFGLALSTGWILAIAHVSYA
jgi:hypothetical protein